MESVHTSNLRNPTSLESDKTTTSFVKDATKIMRYSLSDSAERANSTSMDYHFEILNKNDINRVLQFLRKFFFRDEPLNKCVELIPEGEDSTCVELEKYCMESSFENNLSLMAVSAKGDIIGVVLTGKANTTWEENPTYIQGCENLKFKKILRLLNYVDKHVKAGNRFKDSNVLDIKIISVDTNWRGQGIGRILMKKVIEVAKEQKINYIKVDCSSFFSAKLCERFDFDEIYRLNYADYLDDKNKPVFSPAQPHTAVISYIRKL